MSRLRHLFLRLVMPGSNVLANLLGVTFAQVVSSRVEQPLTPSVRGDPLVSAADLLFSPLAFLLVWTFTHVYERPLHAYLTSAAAGRAVPEALARRARRRLLNEPFVTMLFDFAMWAMAAVLFPLLFWHAGAGPQAIQRSIVNSLAIGVITVIAAFFLQEHALRRYVAPVVFPQGGLAAVPGTRRIRIATRLAALLLAGNLLPLVSILLLLFRVPAVHPDPQAALAILQAAVLTYALVFIAVGTGLTVLIGRNLTRPFGEIIAALREVREGRFDRRVRVTTNDEIGYTGDTINEMTAGLQERERLRRDMSLAMEVQQNLLPRRTPNIEGFDIAGASLYCEETGGDYFDYFQWPAVAGTFGAAVADVSGHGIPSALLMSSLRAFLRQRMAHPHDLGRVADDVNRQLARDVEDTGRFATMFLGVFDRPGSRLRWVNAGHDPALVYDPVLDRFDELGRTGLALGVSETGTHREGVHGLAPGSIVAIGTDGIWEACDRQARMFGKTRVREIIRRQAHEPARVILEGVMNAVKAHCGTLPPTDDLTLVVVKVG